MTKKLLIARVGIGTLTVALCAALPGCNLGAMRYDPAPNTSSGNHPDADGATDTFLRRFSGVDPLILRAPRV